jgi:hypothetical protein
VKQVLALSLTSYPHSLLYQLCFCLLLQSVVDAAEQKAQFDAQLDKATADASEMKAAFDKVCLRLKEATR